MQGNHHGPSTFSHSSTAPGATLNNWIRLRHFNGSGFPVPVFIALFQLASQVLELVQELALRHAQLYSARPGAEFGRIKMIAALHRFIMDNPQVPVDSPDGVWHVL